MVEVCFGGPTHHFLGLPRGMAVGPAFSLCTANDLELLICGLPGMANFKENPLDESLGIMGEFMGNRWLIREITREIIPFYDGRTIQVSKLF